MPSSLKQKIRIVDVKSKKTGNGKSVAIIKKTGYLNLTMNGKTFYYNASMTNQSMTQKNITQQFVNANTPAKRTIVITRKS